MSMVSAASVLAKLRDPYVLGSVAVASEPIEAVESRSVDLSGDRSITTREGRPDSGGRPSFESGW